MLAAGAEEQREYGFHDSTDLTDRSSARRPPSDNEPGQAFFVKAHRASTGARAAPRVFTENSMDSCEEERSVQSVESVKAVCPSLFRHSTEISTEQSQDR